MGHIKEIKIYNLAYESILNRCYSSCVIILKHYGEALWRSNSEALRRKLKGCHQFQPNAQTDARVTLVKLEVTSCAATPVQVPSSR